MPILGQFDTDAAALSARVRSHDRFGSRSLNAWIFGQLDVRPGHAVLDLGCGTGRQSLPLAELVGPAGRIVAVDASAEALANLLIQAGEAGLEERFITIHAPFDHLDEVLPIMPFDRVVGAYALYYADHRRKLFDIIHSRMRHNGVLFFCGPGANNNAEIKQFHADLSSAPLPAVSAAAEFMETTGRQLAHDFFDEVYLSSFENALKFDSAEALLEYWRAYNLYDRELEDAFKAAADQHFADHALFTTVKRVIGITAVKRPGPGHRFNHADTHSKNR